VQAVFSRDGVNGFMVFKQDNPYKPTMVQVDLQVKLYSWFSLATTSIVFLGSIKYHTNKLVSVHNKNKMRHKFFNIGEQIYITHENSFAYLSEYHIVNIVKFPL